MNRSDSSPTRRPTLAAPVRATAIVLAVASILVSGSACGFRVPEGSVYVSKTTGLEGHMLGLEFLLGPSYAVKVRYAGGKEWAQFFYEHYVGDELVMRKPISSEGLAGEGFTWRSTIRLEPLPPIPGRDRDDPLYMLALARSAGKRFTGRSVTIVEGLGPDAPTEVDIGSDRNEFRDDEEIPLVEFYRRAATGRTISGETTKREAQRIVVKLRLYNAGEVDPIPDPDAKAEIPNNGVANDEVASDDDASDEAPNDEAAADE